MFLSLVLYPILAASPDCAGVILGWYPIVELSCIHFEAKS